MFIGYTFCCLLLLHTDGWCCCFAFLFFASLVALLHAARYASEFSLCNHMSITNSAVYCYGWNVAGTTTRTTVIWLQQLLIMLGQAVAIATATAISYCLARALHINSVDGRIQWTWSTWHTNSKMLNSTTTPADYLVIYLTYYQI